MKVISVCKVTLCCGGVKFIFVKLLNYMQANLTSGRREGSFCSRSWNNCASPRNWRFLFFRRAELCADFKSWEFLHLFLGLIEKRLLLEKSVYQPSKIRVGSTSIFRIANAPWMYKIKRKKLYICFIFRYPQLGGMVVQRCHLTARRFWVRACWPPGALCRACTFSLYLPAPLNCS